MTEHSPYPASITRLIDEFNKLPGIGIRSAERLAYHILASRAEEAMALAMAIRDVKKSIRACKVCFNVTDEETCSICCNPRRDRSVICVVELPRDAIAFEKAGGYNGLYHILQGHVSPADSIAPEDLRCEELLVRIKNPDNEASAIEEVILATNPTAEGDLTANILAESLAPLNVRVSRLARGLASGTELEATAPSSLQFALQGRQLHRVTPDAAPTTPEPTSESEEASGDA